MSAIEDNLREQERLSKVRAYERLSRADDIRNWAMSPSIGKLAEALAKAQLKFEVFYVENVPHVALVKPRQSILWKWGTLLLLVAGFGLVIMYFGGFR